MILTPRRHGKSLDFQNTISRLLLNPNLKSVTFKDPYQINQTPHEFSQDWFAKYQPNILVESNLCGAECVEKRQKEWEKDDVLKELMTDTLGYEAERALHKLASIYNQAVDLGITKVIDLIQDFCEDVDENLFTPEMKIEYGWING